MTFSRGPPGAEAAAARPIHPTIAINRYQCTVPYKSYLPCRGLDPGRSRSAEMRRDDRRPGRLSPARRRVESRHPVPVRRAVEMGQFLFCVEGARGPPWEDTVAFATDTEARTEAALLFSHLVRNLAQDLDDQANLRLTVTSPLSGLSYVLELNARTRP